MSKPREFGIMLNSCKFSRDTVITQGPIDESEYIIVVEKLAYDKAIEALKDCLGESKYCNHVIETVLEELGVIDE